MRTSILILNAGFLITLSVSSFAIETPDCEDSDSWAAVAKQDTIEKCTEAVEKFADSCEPESNRSTSATVNSKYAQIGCLKNILNKELDKRLLVLKKKDKTNFRTEMQIQKSFNNFSSALCEKLNSCMGTVYRISKADCLLQVYTWRTKQAMQINESNLTFKTEVSKNSKKPADKSKPNQDLFAFAKGLCHMPKEVFQSHSIPQNCEEAVVQEVTNELGADCEKE